jgi:hypothetical protein
MFDVGQVVGVLGPPVRFDVGLRWDDAKLGGTELASRPRGTAQLTHHRHPVSRRIQRRFLRPPTLTGECVDLERSGEIGVASLDVSYNTVHLPRRQTFRAGHPQESRGREAKLIRVLEAQ